MAFVSDLIISSDSHVMEPVDLWKKGVSAKYRDTAPLFRRTRSAKDFSNMPAAGIQRAHEGNGSRRLERRGAVSDAGLDLFGLDDAGLQEACFRVYNDWLIDYCRPPRTG